VLGLAARFAGQLADPNGLGGRWLGVAMDLANARALRHALDLLQPEDGEWVLDAGCGTGAALRDVRRRAACRMTGIDRSQTMIDVARQRLGPQPDLQVADITTARLDHGAIDKALLLNVLYFCDPAGNMVQAVRRSLRPGGRVVAYVTHRSVMARWAFVRAGKHRLFDEAELRAVLIQGGFVDHRIRIEQRDVARGVPGLFAIATA